MKKGQGFSFLVFCFIILGCSSKVFSENDSLFVFGIEDKLKKLLPDSVEKADSLARVLITYAEDSGNDTLASSGWYFRGEAAYYQGHFDFAGDCYEKSIGYLNGIEKPEKNAIYFNNLGLTRYFKERYNEALEAFLKSSEYERKTGNDYGFAQCLHNIALVQDKAGRYESAEKYFDHSLNIFLELDSLADAAAVLNDYAIYLAGRGLNNRAIEKYGEAIEIYRKIGDSEGIAKVKCNIGALFLYEKDYAKSASYLKEALDYFNTHSSSSYLINIYSLLGDLYYEQGRNSLAVVFYERAEHTARNMGWNNLRQKNLYSLFKALKAEGDYEKAVDVLETYSQLKDSLIISNKAYLEETIDNELEKDLMEKEFNLMRARNNQKNLILIILGLMVILGIVAWFLYGRSNLLKKEKEKQVLQQKIHQLQMNPHLIFNVLSSVQNYILEDKKDEAVEYLNDIADLVRKLLDVGDMELIPLEEEIDLLNKYLKVQCRRYFQKIDCGVDFRVISGSRYLLVPPMLVRPLIDALFSKGKVKDNQCPGINIYYEQKEDGLELTLENKGVYVKNDISKESIELIEERLSLLSPNGKKPRLEIIDLISEDGKSGSKVRCRLPLITKN